jgi:hypothetical protein
MIAAAAFPGKPSDAREGIGCGGQKKPLQGPKNRLASDSRSTMRISEGLPTRDDVRRAARHVLRDWKPEAVERGIGMLTNPDIDLEALGLSPKRSPWPAVAALQVLAADRCGDIETFWRAGHVALEVWKQSQRASAPRGLDALSRQIAELLEHDPQAKAAATFARWAELASGFLAGCVCDAYGDGLSWEDETLTTHHITREAFTRRFDRIKKLKTPTG